jgi:hypothetical protein
LPFWVFDVGGEIRWTGLVRAKKGRRGPSDAADLVASMASVVLEGKVDTTGDKGQWERTGGTISLVGGDFAVPATRSLPDDLLDRLKFDLSIRGPYSDEVIKETQAEVYTVPMVEASLRAWMRAGLSVDPQVQQKTGRRTSDLEIDRSGIRVQSYKLVLLPSYIGAYTNRGRVRPYIVNGQSGEVVGDSVKEEGFFRRLMGGIGNS